MRWGTLPWAVSWVRGSRTGLFVIAALVGVGSGLGAVVFRYLIYVFTWLATGHVAFGQDGHVGSLHLPWLGLAFFVVIPVIGGLIYGPLIYRYAREARGHGVPEVMMAVAQNGGRIRPQVSLVKAVASALCIGTGGSVGREGPIVQIGSALASSVGQWAKMPQNRMRILVACGAGGGIAATFNAPLTGVFFGVEIILREFSIDALFTVMLSAVLADAVAIGFLGDRPFLAGFPPGIVLRQPWDYLLVAVLAVAAALIGVVFKNVVYKTEDLCDRVWGKRPEWARPAIGGIALGLVLLALPQLYGVGYPVMYQAVARNYALWFLLVLTAGKIIACSLTLGIGGSGGVFAPSLFIGATSGMAFGEIAGHLLGPAAGPPALYAVVAMAAVFASAARAPLTSVASVVEMTGDYTLTLPVMLAVAIAATTSRGLSYGTIYTTKLLRRGYDIDRGAPWRALQRPESRRRGTPALAPPTAPGRPQGAASRPGAFDVYANGLFIPAAPAAQAEDVPAKRDPGRYGPMTNAIEMFGLTKRYGGTTAVADLNLRVEPGQVFGFLGPNGAGKSTTIRMLLALQRPTGGRAALLGLDAATDSVEIHRRVGYLPGDLELFPRLTGRQHIVWFARARNTDAGSAARQLIDRFQVVADRPVRELSKGNRQKIGLVLAFMHRPELLVLDEPTSGLDPLMQHEFESLLRETVAEGRTVFLSSHELAEVQRVAGRIGIIRKGRLVAEDTVDGLRRAAPQKMEVRFRQPVDPAELSTVSGVTVTASDGPRVTLDVTGEIGPVLRVIASHDPVDLISRPPGLDELFLGFYRDSPEREASHAR